MKLMKTYNITGTKRDVHAFCDEFGRNDGISNASERDIADAWFYIEDQTPIEVKYIELLKQYSELKSRIIRRWTKLSLKDWAAFPLLAVYLEGDDRYLPLQQAKCFFREDICKCCGIPVYRQIADLECPLLRKGKHSANLFGDNSSTSWGLLVSSEFREFMEREAPDAAAFRPVKDIRNHRYSDKCFQMEVKVLLPPIPARWRKLNIEAECHVCGLKRITLSSDNGPTDFCEVRYVFEQSQCSDFQLAATREYLGSYGCLTEAARQLFITQEFWQKVKAAKIKLGAIPARWYNPETDDIKPS